MHLLCSIKKFLLVFLLGTFVWFAPKDFNSENLSFVSTVQAESFTSAMADELQCLADKGVIGAAAYGAKNAAKGIWNFITSGINWATGTNISQADIESCTEEGKTFTRVYASFMSVQSGCWFCPVFGTLYDTINKLASTMNNPNQSGSLAKVIAGGKYSLLWLLLYGYIIFKVGQMLITSAFKGLSPMEVFTEVFYPFLRCVVAAILIHSSTAIFTYLVDPMLVASIGFGKTIQDAGGSTARTITAGVSTGSTTTNACATLTYTGMTTDNASLNSLKFADSRRSGGIQATFNTLSGPGTNKVFSDAVGNSIQCFLSTISQNLVVWMAVGATFMADCWGLGFMHILPHWAMLFVGIILFVGAFIIFLSFPLKLLDAMFRLMFVAALMPLWIAFWVIPQTRGYTTKAFEMLVHIMVDFIILSVVMVMVLKIIESLFDSTTSGFDIDTLVQLLEEGKTKPALEKIDFSGLGIFLCAAMMYLAFSLIGKAETFVGQFAKGGSLGIGKDTSSYLTKGTQLAGKVGAKGAAAVGRTVVAPATAVVGGWAMGAGKWAAGKAATPVKNWANKVKSAYNEGKTEGETTPNRDSTAYRAGHVLGETKRDMKGNSSEGNNRSNSRENSQNETWQAKANAFAEKAQSMPATDAQGQKVDQLIGKDSKGNIVEIGTRTHHANGSTTEQTEGQEYTSVKKTYQDTKGNDISETETTWKKTGGVSYNKNYTNEKNERVEESIHRDANGVELSHTVKNLVTGELKDLLKQKKDEANKK